MGNNLPWDPETNSEFTPKNGWLEDECFPFGMFFFFRWRLLLVSGSVNVDVITLDKTPIC